MALRAMCKYSTLLTISVTCFAAAGTHHPAVVYRSIFQANSEWNTSGHLGNLCLSCFDSLIKGISCDTSRNEGNFNGRGPNSSLYFSAISSCNWGMSERVYLFRLFFKPTDSWVRQFALSFLSLLLGCDFLDSHSLSLWGIFGSSCFNAFIETFFLFFCGFPSPTLYLFAWLQMILSFNLRQLFMKSIITLCFVRQLRCLVADDAHTSTYTQPHGSWTSLIHI